ncbi:hypothetical protein KM043_002074 [Ampulex compressa]|nr:hypothetical protein KM043_002074 [Ampulex compressa]
MEPPAVIVSNDRAKSFAVTTLAAGRNLRVDRPWVGGEELSRGIECVAEGGAVACREAAKTAVARVRSDSRSRFAKSSLPGSLEGPRGSSREHALLCHGPRPVTHVAVVCGDILGGLRSQRIAATTARTAIATWWISSGAHSVGFGKERRRGRPEGWITSVECPRAPSGWKERRSSRWSARVSRVPKGEGPFLEARCPCERSKSADLEIPSISRIADRQTLLA